MARFRKPDFPKQESEPRQAVLARARRGDSRAQADLTATADKRRPNPTPTPNHTVMDLLTRTSSRARPRY